MASVRLTEQTVADDLVILNLEKVDLSDEQFVELCLDNRELHLELVQCLENPATLHGDPVLPGFVFPVTEVWQH